MRQTRGGSSAGECRGKFSLLQDVNSFVDARLEFARVWARKRQIIWLENSCKFKKKLKTLCCFVFVASQMQKTFCCFLGKKLSRWNIELFSLPHTEARISAKSDEDFVSRMRYLSFSVFGFYDRTRWKVNEKMKLWSSNQLDVKAHWTGLWWYKNLLQTLLQMKLSVFPIESKLSKLKVAGESLIEWKWYCRLHINIFNDSFTSKFVSKINCGGKFVTEE